VGRGRGCVGGGRGLTVQQGVSNCRRCGVGQRKRSHNQNTHELIQPRPTRQDEANPRRGGNPWWQDMPTWEARETWRLMPNTLARQPSYKSSFFPTHSSCVTSGPTCFPSVVARGCAEAVEPHTCLPERASRNVERAAAAVTLGYSMSRTKWLSRSNLNNPKQAGERATASSPMLRFNRFSFLPVLVSPFSPSLARGSTPVEPAPKLLGAPFWQLINEKRGSSLKGNIYSVGCRKGSDERELGQPIPSSWVLLHAITFEL
jgi:hypothetical protein